MPKQKIIKIISAIACLLIVILLSIIITYNVLLGPVSKDSSNITFEIPYKTTSNEVLASLKEQGLI